MLVRHGGVHLVDGDAVHLGYPTFALASRDELGDDVGTNPDGKRRLSEAAVRVEHDWDLAPEWVEPFGVAVTLTCEVDLLDERLRRIGERQAAVPLKDDDAQSWVETPAAQVGCGQPEHQPNDGRGDGEKGEWADRVRR